ncbi:MAG: cytochrome c-type biogenesis protein CcmH [Chloroflexi bacterium]|nr:cytochrome c-type biogenesis protein CcmH [Chloroflexota bacterium]
MTRTRVALLLAVIAIACALALAARAPAPTNEARADRLAEELRCPVCQGLSVRDSPSETARQMRELAAQRVAEGRNDDQIRDEFRASYGDWVLLAPPLLAWSGLVWVVPFALVVLGFVLAGGLLRRRQVSEAAPTAAQLATLRERVANDPGVYE